MKSFSKFLIEATQSQASMQAKKLNLKSDGHGGWLDSRGNFVAVTEKGKLKFVDKKGKKKEEEPQKEPVRKTTEPSSEKPKKEPAPEEKPQAKGTPKPEDGSEDSDTLTVAFGRFNPPTVGHEKLLKAAKKAAKEGTETAKKSSSERAWRAQTERPGLVPRAPADAQTHRSARPGGARPTPRHRGCRRVG